MSVPLRLVLLIMYRKVTRAQNEETRGCAFVCKDKLLVAKGKKLETIDWNQLLVMGQVMRIQKCT